MLETSLKARGAVVGALRKRPGPVLGLVLLTLVAVSFAPLARNGFILVDDVDLLVGNPHLREGFTTRNLAWAFTNDLGANWFPVTWLSYLLDYRLFGLNAGASHLVSLLFHAASALLLFAVLRALTGHLWCSLLAAALFGLHPLHVESVAWAAYRKDVLSGFFWVLTLGAYLRYVRGPTALRYAGLLLLFALGLMAKPVLVTLPFLLALLDWWPLGRWGRPGGVPAGVPRPGLGGRVDVRVLEKVPLLILAAAVSVVTYRVQEGVGALAYFQHLTLPARIANALVSYVVYLRQAAWPRGLAVFYPHPGQAPPPGQWVGALLLLTAVSALAFWMRRRRPWLAAGWLWYLGTLLPMIGLVQAGLQARADRYTYLSLTGVFIMVAWSAGEWVGRRRRRRPAAAVAAIAATAVLAVACRRQTALWRDTLTLFTHAAAVTERNWMAENNIGAAWGNRGDNQKALEHFEKALAYRPDYPDALHNYRKAVIRRAMAGSGHPGTGPAAAAPERQPREGPRP